MSARAAESVLCCSRCLRVQAGPSSRRITTSSKVSAKQQGKQRARYTAASTNNSSVAHSQPQQLRIRQARRSFTSTREVRNIGDASSELHSTLHNAPIVAPSITDTSAVPQASSSESLKRQLEDLRTLLLRITGNDEARSTRLVAFPSYHGTGGIDEEKAWINRLERGIVRLGKQRQQTTRVAVLGKSSGELARFSQALLEDPLSSDTSLAQALRARTTAQDPHATDASEFNIRSGLSSSAASETTWTIPSEWLHSQQIDLVELKTAEGSSSIGSQIWNSLLASDIVVVLSPPTDKGDLARLARKPNVIFLKASADALPEKLLAPATTRPSHPSVTKEAISSPLQSMIVDPSLAIQANAILSKSQPYAGGTTSSSEDFASLFLRSGIPQLREVLEGLIAGPLAPPAHSIDPPSQAQGGHLHAQTASHLASAFLLDLSSAVAEARSTLHTAAGELGQLDLRAARDKRHSEIELGFTDLGQLDLEMLVTDNPAKPEGGVASNAPLEKVKDAVTQHRASVREVVDSLDTKAVEDIQLLEDGQRDVARALNAKRLRWYKLPFGRADDIATDLSNALAGYFADLERKLIFETGRLSERSLALSGVVDSYLKGPSAFGPRPKDQPSLFSATLQNQLVALSPTTQFGFPPAAHPAPVNVRQTSLSLPIISRKAQLSSAGGPIEKLQIRAQSAAMQFYSISGGSIAAAIFLSQTPMQELAVDLPTSVGIGLLGTVLAGWRLQGAWKRSKERFWTDWKRAQEGLSFDLQANARDALDKKIFVKADTARLLLRKQLDARQQALQAVEQALRKAQAELSSQR